MKTNGISHDEALFATVIAVAQAIEPEVRRGSMFGCPAIYHGRTLAACVYRDQVGIRIPAALAAESRSDGRSTPFRPYGKPEMREWVALAGSQATKRESTDLIAAAIDYARRRQR